MGGDGEIVEIDETYIGRKDGFEVKRGFGHKNAVFTLVERGGSARSFHVEDATKDTILPIIRENLDRESHVMTRRSKPLFQDRRGVREARCCRSFTR